MIQALHTAASGMAAMQKGVDVAANNLANAQTTGFKAKSAQFSDLMYQQDIRPGSLTSAQGGVIPAGVQVGTGVQTIGTTTRTEQGGFTQTDNTFDLAIQGEGMFGVEKPNGEVVYTRDGSFQVGPDGRLVTQEGYAVSSNVVIDPEVRDIQVSPDGQVTGFVDGEPEAQVLGQIDLFVFQNPAGMQDLGSNLKAQSESSGPALARLPGDVGTGTLKQGWLENSNVNPITELTSTIRYQSNHTMASRVIRAADEMLQSVGQLK